MLRREVSPQSKFASTANTEKSQINEMKINKLSLIVLVILIVLAIGGIGSSWHYYGKYQTLKNNPNIEADKVTAELISSLGRLMELPKGETPTVATISDKAKLANQPFFKMAENGDVLFAYTTAMKAILYRPTTNKIINVAPISINQPETTTPPAAVKPVVPNTTNTTSTF